MTLLFYPSCYISLIVSRYTLDLHKIKHMKKYTVPKRYYPPKTECLDEYDIEGRERQAIVHGRSVSLPYDKGNNFKIQRIPIQKEYEGDSNSSQATDSPRVGMSRGSSPIIYQPDSYSSLDDLTTERECYYPRSSSADLLDLPSTGYTRSSSRFVSCTIDYVVIYFLNNVIF